MGFESIDQPGRSSEVECNPKMSILFFLGGEEWQMGFESIAQPSQSSEVECNQKMSILFFWLERGGGWGSSPSTSLADHQKLNVIQKWAFYFFGWRGVADGVWVHISISILNWNSPVSCSGVESDNGSGSRGGGRLVKCTWWPLLKFLSNSHCCTVWTLMSC